MGNSGASTGPLLRRCAWCGRFAVDGRWRRGGALARRGLDPAAATHTICPTCTRRLRSEGLSA